MPSTARANRLSVVSSDASSVERQRDVQRILHGDAPDAAPTPAEAGTEAATVGAKSRTTCRTRGSGSTSSTGPRQSAKRREHLGIECAGANTASSPQAPLTRGCSLPRSQTTSTTADASTTIVMAVLLPPEPNPIGAGQIALDGRKCSDFLEPLLHREPSDMFAQHLDHVRPQAHVPGFGSLHQRRVNVGRKIADEHVHTPMIAI